MTVRPNRFSDRLSGLLRKMELDGKIKHLPSSTSLSLSSNDYLGLAHHPMVIEASAWAARTYGTGATGSRFLSGNNVLNEELEYRVADFKSKGVGLARVFSSGYHANLSVVSVIGTLAGALYSDSENHASLIDGFRLLKAPVHVFPHNDWEWVEDHIQKNAVECPMIVIESLFSMSGEIAPLPELYRIAQRTGGLLVIDEAHATGTIGPTGRGGLEFFGLSFDPDHMVLTGTFSKALGSLGGFAVMNDQCRTLLSSLARPFIYTTALPPSVLAASIRSLEIILESPSLIQRLQALSGKWTKLIKGSSCSSPIINLKGGKDLLDLESGELGRRGFFLPVLCYPTVPKGQESLRLSVNLSWDSKTDEALMTVFSSRMKGFE